MRHTRLKTNLLPLAILAISIAFGLGYMVGIDQRDIKPEAMPQSTASLLVTPPLAPTSQVLSSPSLPPLQLCFSPQQNCEGIIVEEIHKAQESIYIQAYSFTSQPIIYALQKAQERNVKISIILDGKTKAPDYLLHSSLPIYIEKMPGLAHNKVMIIDQKVVLTGSYNFTKAARHRNAENLVKIEDATIAHQYLENWQMHFKRAQGTLS